MLTPLDRSTPLERYERRRPEETVLYQVVAVHLATFLGMTDEAGSLSSAPLLAPWFDSSRSGASSPTRMSREEHDRCLLEHGGGSPGVFEGEISMGRRSRRGVPSGPAPAAHRATTRR